MNQQAICGLTFSLILLIFWLVLVIKICIIIYHKNNETQQQEQHVSIIISPKETTMHRDNDMVYDDIYL